LTRQRSSLPSWRISIIFLVLSAFSISAFPQKVPASPVPIDFSFAGYEAGAAIPEVPAVLLVRPSGADDTALIQGALDRVAAMPLRHGVFRGAVLLAKGRFHIKGHLYLRVSGVVLRGSGRGPDGTVIVADGTGRRTLIVVGAEKDPALGEPIPVQGEVPAGGSKLQLASVAGLAVGDPIMVRRPSTKEWISSIGMTGLPGKFASFRLDWVPGSHDLVWDRTITAIEADRREVEIDAPITTALEASYGGGTVARVAVDALPSHIGIEDLTLESTYDNTYELDEAHSWIAILLDRVQDAWVRRVTARHFVSSAVRVNLRGRRITVEDCRSEAPVGERGGYRRQGFYVAGQQVLVHHCYSEAGMNDFASGMLAGGPNVFLDCEANNSVGPSGAFEGWSSGVLYEQVHVPAAPLELLLDSSRAQGGGWTAANSLIWNSTALSVDAMGPPNALNFVVKSQPPLYASELLARTGRHLENASDAARPDPVPAANLPEFRPADMEHAAEAPPVLHKLEIVNGRLVMDGHALWGDSITEAWWRGDTSIYTAAASTGSSITRFMPGVVAPGETEDLAAMAERLKSHHVASIQVNPGLWYDHRRDSHTVERRTDGNVWAPFYEVPWARSGQGTAWDGLSKFDLGRYNPWYFARHREFAEQAAEKGVVVFYDLYNTHNVLEIGPHWIDYAWRPANNINDTGLPEPPPLEPGEKLNVGNEFFSTSYAPLRELHRAYILHTLDELGDQPNIIFGIAYQYAGPLSFEQFFQDVVREWEEKHQRHIRIALTTSKQTTDAILADPVRSKQIAVVDMRYWEYRPDGSLFAPKAGINEAFRQQIQEAFPGFSDTPPPTTPEMVYRQVREYRDRYPKIAFMPGDHGTGLIPMLMGGAALPSQLKEIQHPPLGGAEPDRIVGNLVRTYLAADLMKMSPKDSWTESTERTWTLAGGPAEPVLMYSLSGDEIALARALPAQNYSGLWLDPRTGATQPAETSSGSGKKVFHKPDTKDWLLLLRPENAAARK
jgi:Family of unknown function (DUF6298)/Putative collagen-binding domain of a collagenase